MALLVDPDAKTYGWFPRHASLPLKDRPVFVVRNMNGRQLRAYFNRLDELAALPTTPEGNAQYQHDLRDLLGGIVLGWHNVTDEHGRPIDFSIEAMLNELGKGGLPELAQVVIPSAVQLDENSLGEFTSPSSTEAAGSVSPAGAADVSTSQASEVRSSSAVQPATTAETPPSANDAAATAR